MVFNEDRTIAIPIYTVLLCCVTCTCIALRGMLTSVLQESQGLTTNTSYGAISDDISTHADFQLVVTMVAEFCSLVILILLISYPHS